MLRRKDQVGADGTIAAFHGGFDFYFLIRSISSLSLRLVQIIRARCTNVDIRLILRLRGLKDSQR